MGESCCHSAAPVSVGGSAWRIDWLCLVIHCQHSWMGVEGKVTCTRKRVGTDCIMHEVRGKQAPNWDWLTAIVLVCSIGSKAVCCCPLFLADCTGARLVCDFCCFYIVSAVVLNISVVLYRNLCCIAKISQKQTPSDSRCFQHTLHSRICAFLLSFPSHYNILAKCVYHTVVP